MKTFEGMDGVYVVFRRGTVVAEFAARDAAVSHANTYGGTVEFREADGTLHKLDDVDSVAVLKPTIDVPAGLKKAIADLGIVVDKHGWPGREAGPIPDPGVICPQVALHIRSQVLPSGEDVVTDITAHVSVPNTPPAPPSEFSGILNSAARLYKYDPGTLDAILTTNSRPMKPDSVVAKSAGITVDNPDGIGLTCQPSDPSGAFVDVRGRCRWKLVIEAEADGLPCRRFVFDVPRQFGSAAAAEEWLRDYARRPGVGPMDHVVPFRPGMTVDVDYLHDNGIWLLHSRLWGAPMPAPAPAPTENATPVKKQGGRTFRTGGVVNTYTKSLPEDALREKLRTKAAMLRKEADDLELIADCAAALPAELVATLSRLFPLMR